MSDQNTPSSSGQDNDLSEAEVKKARFSFVWVFPIVAVLVAGYLGWKSLAERGPDIVLIFDTADGLTSGQTQVKNRAVTLGTVTSISLAKNMKQVEVRVHMNSEAASLLTEKAKFWVVRPRINGASVSGLDTLFSGAYIAFDPGPPGESPPSTHFRGLEGPPGVQSGQPGRTYTLVTDAIGSLGPGTQVFFRDVDVGEVLDYTLPPGGRGPILVDFFVRAPYDSYLRADTRFWNVSGVKIGMGSGGLSVQIQSFEALFAGGIAFGLADDGQKEHPAPAHTVFRLYSDKDAAAAAAYHQRIPVATYFSSSVSGLTTGSPVTMFGIQVGSITDVRLLVNTKTGESRVRVGMEIQPERIFTPDQLRDVDIMQMLRQQVKLGLRASAQNTSFLTGEMQVSLGFVKKTKTEEAYMEGRDLVLPGQAGGMDGIMESVSALTDKLSAIPFEQIGNSAGSLLAHADARINSPEVKEALVQMRDSLKHLNALLADTRKGVDPLLARLPEMSRELDQTLANANLLLAGYGSEGSFGRSLQGMVTQLSGAARSLRLMTTYLTNHPSSLVTGR
ncbi:MlaD family protein [Acetobacter sp. AN02]|uniref:PqiB family protein n=1 Tax=Acetobacter sp. AN02 TaxID=2894186 RepID=UPI00243424C0|nr:MlaD family protein [Acetobacter sp. AN02]MDG6094299.1 MlaD family protein [Acetobacter sp. AN02]